MENIKANAIAKVKEAAEAVVGAIAMECPCNGTEKEWRKSRLAYLKNYRAKYSEYCKLVGLLTDIGILTECECGEIYLRVFNA